ICSENRDSIPDQFHSRKRVQRKPGKDTLSAGTPVNDLSLSGSKEIFLCHYDAFEETEKGVRIFFLCHCLPQKYKSFCQFLRNRSFSKQTKIDIAPSKLKIIHCDRTVKHHGGSIFFQQCLKPFRHFLNTIVQQSHLPQPPFCSFQ